MLLQFCYLAGSTICKRRRIQRFKRKMSWRAYVQKVCSHRRNWPKLKNPISHIGGLMTLNGIHVRQISAPMRIMNIIMLRFISGIGTNGKYEWNKWALATKRSQLTESAMANCIFCKRQNEIRFIGAIVFWHWKNMLVHSVCKHIRAHGLVDLLRGLKIGCRAQNTNG